MKCSKCGRPVAGHLALGCPHGPSCTLPPLTPVITEVNPATSTESINTSEGQQPTVTSAPATVVTSASPAEPPPQATSASLPIPTSSGTGVPSTSPASSHNQGEVMPLSNAQLEARLVNNCSSLQSQINQIEQELSSDRVDSILRLQARSDDLQERLAALQMYKSQRHQVLDPLNSIQAALIACRPPPAATHTSVTWAHQAIPSVNPVIPSANPTQSASFAAFSQSAHPSHRAFGPLGGNPGISQGIPGIPQGIPASSSNSARSAQSLPSIPASLDTATARDLVTQFAAALGQSLPAFQAPRGSHIANQNEQGASAMAAQQIQDPFITPDQILSLNPLAKAVLSIPDDSREEREVLGKYIPELYARNSGKIEDIRAKMSYPEFMAMFLRMLVEMLKDDPALVPDRILFLSRIANKAARYRWADVRQCYTCAMRDIKLKLRKWSDDLRDIEEELPPMVYEPRTANQQRPRPQPKSADGKLPYPCRDWNDKECTRRFCKFDHNCYICFLAHPAKVCQHRPANAIPPQNNTNA